MVQAVYEPKNNIFKAKLKWYGMIYILITLLINYSFLSSFEVNKTRSPGTVRCRLPLAML